MANRREPETAQISAVTHDGMGIAALPGKKVFVAGALEGETVRFQRRKRRRNFDVAELLEVVSPSPSRIEPRCAAFGRCGGCSLQHVSDDEQRRIKQQSLADSLERIGRVMPQRWLSPLVGPDSWHYRRRARLAAKYVPGKGRVLVGFRERHAPFVTDMHRCEVLGLPVAMLLDPLSELLTSLSVRDRVPQIEVAIADNAVELVFRVLDTPSDDDVRLFTCFAAEHGVRVALQSGNADTIELLAPAEDQPPLSYSLPAFEIEMQFAAADFVQVNGAVNALMVARAVELLDVSDDDRVLDLFCGIGNFTLPLARQADRVLGVEGEERLLSRARANALHNGIDNVEFVCADLEKISGDESWATRGYDRVLLDPARSGAAAVVEHINTLDPARLVYVSCHPGTLARDARELDERGYALSAAGIIDMFPHTTHVESVAVFDKII